MKRLVLCLLLASCAPPVAPTVVPSCASVCAHRRELGCAAGKPTPAGVSCETVCENAVSHGLRIDLECRIVAPTCDAMDDCGLAPTN